LLALCAAYQWPKNAPGGGKIGVVELGGGWVPADMSSFFESIGQKVPTINNVSVDGTVNAPTPGNDSPDYEVTLDIQAAAGSYCVATGGQLAEINVYFSKNIDTAILKALADGCDVCTISWGGPENQWPAGTGEGSAVALEAAMQAAVAGGMVVIAAAGDSGSGDGENGQNVDLPAGCPHALGGGGTTKIASPASEYVWNDGADDATGGGFSSIWPMQSWQSGAQTPPSRLGREVPDFAANGDPNTGLEIFCHGSSLAIGGTSVVAPFMAGLIAACGKKLALLTPNGIGPLFYSNLHAFTQITVGNNGVYDANTPVNPCCGVGVPNGTAVLALLTGGVVPVPIQTPVPTPAPAPIPTPSPTPSPTPPTSPTQVQLLAALATIYGWYKTLMKKQLPSPTVQQAFAVVEAYVLAAVRSLWRH